MQILIQWYLLIFMIFKNRFSIYCIFAQENGRDLRHLRPENWFPHSRIRHRFEIRRFQSDLFLPLSLDFVFGLAFSHILEQEHHVIIVIALVYMNSTYYISCFYSVYYCIRYNRVIIYFKFFFLIKILSRVHTYSLLLL